MKTINFIAENNDRIEAFYEKEIKTYFEISFIDFVNDLTKNFRKITTSDDFKLFDLIGNMQEAKSRLGLFDCKIETTYTTPYAESNHAKVVNYFGKEKAKTMYAAK